MFFYLATAARSRTLALVTSIGPIPVWIFRLGHTRAERRAGVHPGASRPRTRVHLGASRFSQHATSALTGDLCQGIVNRSGLTERDDGGSLLRGVSLLREVLAVSATTTIRRLLTSSSSISQHSSCSLRGPIPGRKGASDVQSTPAHEIPDIPFWTGYKEGLRKGVADGALAPLSNMMQGLDRRSVEKRTSLPPGPDASPQEVQAYRDAVRLSKATAPLYSKGGYQLITPDTYLTGLGRNL